MPDPTINEFTKPSLLPSRPFDGQVFIDKLGIKWIYGQELDCWISDGRAPEIPLASENNAGLLDRSLKKLLNTIPEKGGSFGIIVKPFLSLRPFNVKPLFSDKILRKAKSDANYIIYGEKPFAQDSTGKYSVYTKSSMAGLLLRFNTGKLKGKQFQIFDNDDGKIFIDGDLESAKVGDSFELYDPVELNPHGILSGNIEIVSNSLDIKCVKGADLQESECQDNKSSDAEKPDGLLFSIKQKFLDSLCFEVPGCRGPDGDPGSKGDAGSIGTGDGPVGIQGEAGKDFEVIKKFSGIKIEDIDDVYDTAVVALEPDPSNGKIYVVKAKIATPSNNTPADQVIASAIFRAIEFEEEFFFKIIKPVVDPISLQNHSESDSNSTKSGISSTKSGISVGIPTGEPGCYLSSNFDNDVLVCAMPKGGKDKDGSSQVAVRWLSDLLSDISQYYRDKLQEAADLYDKQIKEFITTTDKEARGAICQLAQQLAECEWELPLEFCLGLVQDDCGEDKQEKTSFPIAASLFGSEKYNDDTNPQAQLVSKPFVLGGEGEQYPPSPVVVRTDGKNSTGREVSNKGEVIDGGASEYIPKGDYLLIWDTGSITDFSFPQLGHFVGGAQSNNYGVKVQITDPSGNVTVKNFPVPDILKRQKITPTTELGAYCVPVPPGTNITLQDGSIISADYFCDIKPFAATPNPQWLKGAFIGYWSPADIRKYDGQNQVPAPGFTGPTSTTVPYDSFEVDQAYKKADLLKKAVAFSFDADGGKVQLLCPLLGGGKAGQFSNRDLAFEQCISGTNVIKFKLYRIVDGNLALFF